MKTYIREYSYLKEQEKLYNKVDKFDDILTLAETRMLKLLISHCLLLDIGKEIDRFGKTRLVAYDLSRSLIFQKYF